MRLLRLLTATALVCCLAGCHSAFVEATVRNRTNGPISPMEVDYPSASFGSSALLPGQDYHYRFKVQGSGPTKLLWTDAAHGDHAAAGPELREDDEGRLTVTLNPGGPAWEKHLTNHGQPR